MSALDLLHGLVLDDGRRWGEVAVDWQRADARAVLAPAKGEPRLHWLGRPKGGSKTTDLAGMSSVWLVDQAQPLQEGFAVAADRDQANRLLDRARGIIARTSGLAEVLEVQSHRIVHRRNGARVVALEADVAGSEGLLSPWFVVDELPNWAATISARGMWTSVVSAVPKWPGCRLVVIGHAGDPAHWSHGVLEVAKADAGWRVHEVAGPLSWITEGDLAMQRALLLPSEYARRHLNQWTSAEDRLTTVDDVRACLRDGVELEARTGVRYVVTLDIGLVNDRTVVSVAHHEDHEGGRVVVLDRQAVWKGTKASPVRLEEVEAYIVEASRAFNGAPLVFDPFQAAHLTQRLRKAGVRVIEFTFTQTSIGRLCVTLFRLLRDHLVELPDDAELVEELVNARVIERSPGVYRIDHDSGRHDDRVIGLALAAQHLTDKPSGGRGRLNARPAAPPLVFGRKTWGGSTSAAPAEEPPKRKRGIKVRW